DLGLARFLYRKSDDGLTANLTQVGASATLGTADYLPPEQALDFHNVDIRADLYSLGCTAYFLLLGKPPFAGGTLAQKLMRHQQAEPPPLLRPDVPPALQTCLRRLLAKRPEDSYQTPGALADAFAQIKTSGRAVNADTVNSNLASD